MKNLWKTTLAATLLLVGVILNGLTGVTASRLMIASLSQYKPLQKTWLYGARRIKAND